MTQTNALSKAVKLAILGVGTAAMMPFGAIAQDQTAAIEEVMVTGSRIPSAVSDAPRPVTSIGIEDIKMSGIDNIADVMRQTTYNTVGSYREQSGSSWGGAALVDLKGMGPDRTAVLINGRRVPGNPFIGSSAVDMNSIPMAAVKSIEILTDSASAVYGADAIGGVVNVIMKDDWEGAEIQVGGTRPDRDNADSNNFSATFGKAGDKGSIIFSAEWYKKNPIFDADRDYTTAKITGNSGINGLPVDGLDMQGINGGGNSAFSMDFSEALGAIGPCNSAGLTPVANPFGVPGIGCGFAYADYSAITMGLERKSTFVDARYKLNDDHELFLENRYSQRKSFGRFAPAIGGFLVDANAPLNEFGEDYILYHRFVAHGPRDDNAEANEFDTTIGMNGSLFDNQVNYEVYARQYSYDAAEEGDTYIITSIIEDLVANGEYNFVDPFDPANADAVAQSSATLFRDISTEYTAFGISFDGTLGDFTAPGGEIGWAAGWEKADEDYEDQYDSYREAVNVLGSAGNSSAGSRQRDAVFAEVQVPVFENLVMNFAGRYDDYSDFGGKFSPSFSTRYEATDWLTVRASWGEGFKAPNLLELYQNSAQSFDGVKDLVRCQAQGIASGDCPSAQVENYTGGNDQLDAETSESVNFGIIVEPFDGLLFSLDWWKIEMEDVVKSLELEDIIDLELAGALPNGVVVNRAPTVNGIPGAITRCEGSGLTAPDCGLVNVYANLAEREVEGIDFRANYMLDTNFGNFTFNTSWSHIAKYDEVIPVTGTIKRAGTEAFPENRVNFSVRYGWDNFTFNYMYNWIDETESNAGGTYDAWDTHDINLVWAAPFGTEFAFGVQNLTDEDPSLESETGWNSETSETSLQLYSVAGRVFTASMRHRF